ncbi:MAG: hypothetical protein ACRED0_12145 [Gammaproteobacteria bacterium]
MFGLDMLDAFIGLITVYLTLTLIVTAIGEGVSQVLCFRGWVKIERLLGQGLARDIFAHRRIQDLQKDQKRMPTYIPDRVFAEGDGRRRLEEAVSGVARATSTTDQCTRG